MENNEQEIETKYINEPSECKRTAEEFLQEFKDHVYPAYASFGLTMAEALNIWKLNSVYNFLQDICEILNKDKPDWL
jgi:hypothetical protein